MSAAAQQTARQPCSTTGGRCSSSPRAGARPDGWGQEHKGGAAYLSVRCGVPVVPVHLDGTGRILPRGARVPTPGRVVINIGAPVRAGAEEDARHLAVRIEQAIASLADETTTDWWDARRRAHSRRRRVAQGAGVRLLAA